MTFTMKTFAAWETEYPSSGSITFKAWTQKGARRKWRRFTGTRGPVSTHPELDVAEMTEELLLTREAMVQDRWGRA